MSETKPAASSETQPAAPAGSGGKKVVVIAVDLSVQSERAFNYYCEHLYRNDHKVILVHSAEYPRMTTGERIAPELWEAELARKEKEMKTVEDYYKDRMKHYKVGGSTRFVYHGKAGETIVRVAEEVFASMVVVGTRGAGVLRRTVLGSVSDYVVHHLKCAVLVCPPPPRGHCKDSYDEFGGSMERQLSTDSEHHRNEFRRFLDRISGHHKGDH